MSQDEKNGPKLRYETILNNVRKEATKLRECNDKLQDLKTQLGITGRPAPAQILGEATVSIHVALEHLRSVFREF